MTDDTPIDVRPTTAPDIPGMQRIVEETALFPPEMLPDLLQSFLDRTAPDLWLTALRGGEAVGLCFAAPERLTDGTWNMLALAVLPAVQGGGIGGRMVAALEDRLRDRSGRLLIVDTSGTEAFARTRRFYEKHGYHPEARIRDYWAAGDDKVTFRKRLA